MADNDKIDEYELINCVATGSATQIWEVKKAGNAQPIAMKLLLEEALADPEHRTALKHEATIGKSMEHPTIIKVYDLKLTKKIGYYTMEYFRSGNLKSLIRSDLPQAQARVKRLMESTSQALAYFHSKGWVHRDIKPENILLNKGGEVRLIDFSLSCKPSNAILRVLTKKSNIAIQGTRTYLAPELIRREALTFSVDMYSLGVTLYETLLGNPPFRTANPNDLLMMHVRDKPPKPSELNDNITPEADDLVLRMLSKKVKDRPASMQDLYNEVRSMKFFKEDPVKVYRELKETLESSDAQANEDRLNSRRDAARDKSKDSERPLPKPKPKVLPISEEKPKAAPQPQSPQFPGYPPQPGMPLPGYPGMMQGMMPGMQPGQIPPGYPMPGFPNMQMPGYPGMMPGMPPGQYPPGMLPGQIPSGYPQQPGFPQQPGMAPYPGAIQPGPPQPAAPQQMSPTPLPRPPQPVPQAPQPAAPQSTAQNQKPAEKKLPQDLPLATIDDLQIE